MFQSRYRAASHFRAGGLLQIHRKARFHLVIERLLMSGCCQQRRLQSRWERYNVSISQSSGFSCQGNAVSDVSPLGNLSLFPSRYRAASHFRSIASRNTDSSTSKVSISLSSGFSFQGIKQAVCRRDAFIVSISLSSGFSFQARMNGKAIRLPIQSFNLVIERLLISGSF